ncbi:hypothetical protein [Niabella aurantiaca]|uniref:hypothetical protein n=1 Tax=Niabella aurantiaca TaxID=379900 RepID=UPI000377B5BD|nr:hypothetical protein [Niabella aurantiaca]
MTTAIKREKLVEYIQQADDKKVQALYAVLEDSIEEEDKGWWWKDDNFVTEINRRSAGLKKGTTKTLTWDAVKRKSNPAK